MSIRKKEIKKARKKQKAVNVMNERKGELRKQISGKRSYIGDESALCCLCRTMVAHPVCYDLENKQTIHLCVSCKNQLKPKRKFIRIISTPMN